MVSSFDGSQNLGVCIVVAFGRSVLVGKRKNGFKSGWYGLPGGRLEVGEPLETCARRELQEEAGLIPASIECVGFVREWQGEYDFVSVVYLCREWSGEPVNRELDKCEGWDWVDAEKLPKQMLVSHVAAVRLARDKKKLLMDLPKR